MTITRRDILKLAGGTTLGLLFTPIPWKLLDDTSIWTQNWDLVPKIPRHPVSYACSGCTLCPAGCALRARSVGGMPVSLQGIAENGPAKGVLCPLGLAAHHLAFSPLRIAGPVVFTSREDDAALLATTREEAASRIAAAIGSRTNGERVAILDARPGRVVSKAYRRFAGQIDDCDYLTAHTGDGLTAHHLAAIFARRPDAVACDLERADLILSIGAPLGDGWGTPERMSGLRRAQRQSRCTVIQAESRRSRTAAQADRWLPLEPLSETAFALGLAHMLLQERSIAEGLHAIASDARTFIDLASAFTPELTAQETGLQASDIIATADALRRAERPIVLAGCDPAGGPLQHDACRMIVALNLLLGSLREQGAFVMRRPLPDETDEPAGTIVDLPDHSVAVLIIDGAENGHLFPWQLLERKLIPDHSLVVSLSPYFGGLAARADLIVPSPAQLESIDELGQATDSPYRSFGIAPPLLPSRKGSTRPTDFLQLVERELGFAGHEARPYEELLEERSHLVHGTGRGMLLEFSTGRRAPVADMTAGEFWTKLSAGGRWVDDSFDTRPAGPVQLLAGIAPERLHPPAPRAGADQGALLLALTGLRGAVMAGPVDPVMSKVFQESELRERTGTVLLNGSTALRHGLGSGDRVRLATSQGSIAVTVRLDETVPDGVALLPVGPTPETGARIVRGLEEDVLSLCTLRNDGSWNGTPAWINDI